MKEIDRLEEFGFVYHNVHLFSPHPLCHIITYFAYIITYFACIKTYTIIFSPRPLCFTRDEVVVNRGVCAQLTRNELDMGKLMSMEGEVGGSSKKQHSSK